MKAKKESKTGLKSEPIVVLLDAGSEKLTGYIMKMNTTGVLVELDKIPFKVGSYLTVSFMLEGAPIVERVRSIKHYDRFFRQPSRPKREPVATAPVPKKLAELHFQKLLEANRVAIVKYSMLTKQTLRR